MHIFRKSKRSFIFLVVATVVTLCITLVSYIYVTEHARSQNWDVLENASATEAKLLRIKLEESTKTLDIVATAVAREGNYSDPAKFAAHIQPIQMRTIFEGVDMILPDGTVFFNSGNVGRLPEGQSFVELAKDGKRMTKRMPGHLHKDRYFVRYLTPVVENGETKALLVGSINCQALGEYFHPDAYNGKVVFCIVDGSDGSFLLDNWHNELGNIYEMPQRKMTPESADHNVRDDIGEMRTGSIAFTSHTNGSKTYMYYRPLYFYNWMLLLGVQEDIVFANLYEVQHILWLAGLFILAFFIWNVLTMRKLNVANDMLSTELKKSKNLEGSLKQALLSAQKANQAKSDFLSRMSHDIRTPINGILGMLEIIRKQRTDQTRVDDALDKIKTSAKHLLTLINSVLDMGKLVRGTFVEQKDNFDLQQTLAECGMMLETQLQMANIKFTPHWDVQHNLLYGNELHLRQVMLNLASNAIKYNKPNGSIDAYVRELGVEQGKVRLEFKIADTGIGMSKEFVENGLFQTFEQENPGMRTEFNGTGLGMAIVHKLVEHMGGKISVESTQGVGSTFTVLLDFALAREESAVEQVASQAVQNLAGLHLLVAEDNKLNLEIVEFLLEDAGATYDCAHNGAEALELFRKAEAGTYDAVLLDVMMPEMDGLEAARQIRALPRADAERVPIIAMTANAFEEDKSKTKAAGMNEHIVKPLEKQVLIEVINKCIQSAQGC